MLEPDRPGCDDQADADARQFGTLHDDVENMPRDSAGVLSFIWVAGRDLLRIRDWDRIGKTNRGLR
eukprot:9592577-Heterocapsa_arctica.AAC.1